MTIKSDDVLGRVKTYESIVKGVPLNEPGVPESFKVLIKELQALALDVKVLNDKNVEIGIRELIEDDTDLEIEQARLKHFEDGQLQGPSQIDLYKQAYQDDFTLGDESYDMDGKKDLKDLLFGDDFDIDDAFSNIENEEDKLFDDFDIDEDEDKEDK